MRECVCRSNDSRHSPVWWNRSMHPMSLLELRGPAQIYINIKSDQSSIQSNPIPSNPRSVDGGSGRTTTADAEGRTCLSSSITKTKPDAESQPTMASHHACSRSQLYSHISNAVGALIDCRKASPSPCRRSYTLRWQTRGMEDPASKESSTAAAASGPASNAKTVLVEHTSSPLPIPHAAHQT